MNLHHRAEVLARKGQRLIRKQFWTVGVNDIWTMDQHDKWRRFQLFLHIGIELHSGLILWLKLWWTNRNPRLVCSWYLDTVEALGYVMPLLTQSDPGTENNGIANAQTELRHQQDPALSDLLQHKFKGNKGNIKPEIAWRRLRYTFTPGFEDLIERGILEGLYDPDDSLERLVFHYIFIPWIQEELDKYVDLTNDTKPCYNRHKVLPHGRPIEIFQNPSQYDTCDFSVKVDKAHLDEVRNKYAPPEHPVFHLVPPAFAEKARQFYGEAGHPVVTRENDDDIRTAVNDRAAMPSVGEDPTGEEWMDLLPLKPFRHRNCLVGDTRLGVRDSDSSAEEEPDYDFNIWSDKDSSSGSSTDA
ncbi:hypothetical protein PHLCEN_2v357 [Hermanssonia centrifuga]|uniref:Integrase core domain-containing protein n=1 Tax=Hermanssonia centrifuga TaxID=98765 RepID=A0A2R6S665_9APHY|nr:hypothetical protein PHLCEN_2v357 [Hermanssonia centrifuga]